MFNLAQRQLRLSLWGTELANRSTGIDSNPAEEAVFVAMLRAWTRTLLKSCFCCCQEGCCSFLFVLKSILQVFSMLL